MRAEAAARNALEAADKLEDTEERFISLDMNLFQKPRPRRATKVLQVLGFIRAEAQRTRSANGCRSMRMPYWLSWRAGEKL